MFKNSYRISKENIAKKMDIVSQNIERKSDLKNLPPGSYSFRGKEGIVKLIVEKSGRQSWDLENWFATLDPDENKEQRNDIIKDIKQRLDPDKGIINPQSQKRTNSFLKRFLFR